MAIRYKKRIFIFLFLAAFLMFAQQPVSIHLTEKDGVPDKEFYSVLEDDNGIVWLAADKGLFSYNGASYEPHIHPEQIGLSVFQLRKDSDNTIWFTNTANQLFYIKDDKITLFKDLKSEFKGQLTTLLIHKDYIILFTTQNVIIIHRKTGKIHYRQEVKQNNKNNILNVIEPYVFNDAVYFGDGFANFYKVNLTTFQSNYIEYSHPYHIGKGVYNLSATVKSKNKLIYSVNYEGDNEVKTFYCAPLDLSKPAIKLKTKFPEVRVVSVYNFENRLWYCTDDGIYICELIGNELVIKNHLFKGLFITDIAKDYNNNYWLTSLNKGLFIVPNIEIKEVEFLEKEEQIDKCFLGDDNELLLMTFQKNIYRYHINKGLQNKLSFKKKNRLHHISFNPYKNEYYLQLKEKLYILDDKFTLKKKQVGTTSIKKIIFLNESELIYAASTVVVRAKLTANDVSFCEKQFKESIRGYTCFYNDKNNQAYFGTSGGFFSYDDNWNKTEILNQNKPIYVKAITQSVNGDLWCSSFKNGVYVVRNMKVIGHYTVNNGLLSNKNSFIKSTGKYVWLAGEQGVQRFDIEKNKFKNLTKQDGIKSFNYNGLELIGNEVYISTPKQLYSFDSEKVFQNKTLLSPYFTGVTIAGVKANIKSKYKLNHLQNKLKIEFNTNGFLSKNNVQYQYRLLGSTTRWEVVPLGTNQVNFNSLSQGNYTFQLKAFNGREYSKVKEIRITINGVFYKQWWFYTLSSLAIISLVWLYFNIRNKRLKEKQTYLLDKQQKELENVFLKLESLRSQMNPHFIFNALNSIQDYIIHNEQKLARKYLVKFSKLIRVYMEHSQKDRISLQEEIDALQLYLELEKDRFEDSFKYEIKLDDHLEVKQIYIPTFLMQPYVENAIKHGLLHKKENRILHIEYVLNKKENTLECTITDNGVGRVASAKLNAKGFKPKSFSSEANQKRINLLNKTSTNVITLVIHDNYDENEIATGTRVVLTVPIEKQTIH